MLRISRQLMRGVEELHRTGDVIEIPAQCIEGHGRRIDRVAGRGLISAERVIAFRCQHPQVTFGRCEGDRVPVDEHKDAGHREIAGR